MHALNPTLEPSTLVLTHPLGGGITAGQLINEAQQAARHTYSPYSQFPVGAALLLKNGTVIHGCNVENASFGLTNCAERTALFTAVTSGQHPKLNDTTQGVALAVWAKHTPNHGIPPCGACRQVMLELLPPATLVLTPHPSDATRCLVFTVATLLPHHFTL